jgi:hypothetical protein
MRNEDAFAVIAGPGTFDFSPAFENAVLCITPSGLFLVVALQRLFWLSRQPRKVAQSRRPILKLARILLRLQANESVHIL